MLMLLGFAAIGGLAIGGIATDRVGARRSQAISLPLLAASFAGLGVSALLLAPHALPALIPLVALWGASGWAFYPLQQDRLIRIAGPADTPVIISLNASFMYLGFSLGAALGFPRHRAVLGRVDRSRRRSLHCRVHGDVALGLVPRSGRRLSTPS